MIVCSPSFIAPYSTLNAHGGIIKIGSGTDILDNATIVANPLHPHTAPAPEVLIGNQVWVGYGAQILGPSTIGAYGSAVKPTQIGPGAVIDQATIEPGAIVDALARVGPGVTMPSGYRVLPGKNVTTNAEASNPAVGIVVPVTNSDVSNLNKMLAANLSWRRDTTRSTRASQRPVRVQAWPPRSRTSSTATWPRSRESASSQARPPRARRSCRQEPVPSSPRRIRGSFRSPCTISVPGSLAGRSSTPRAVSSPISLGRSNSIRADLGQPIAIGSNSQTGSGSPSTRRAGGQLTIGQNLVVGNNAAILGDATTKIVIGDNVTIGNGAVLEGASLGSGSAVGDRAFLLNSTFPAGTQIPAGAIYDNNVLVGFVEW